MRLDKFHTTALVAAGMIALLGLARPNSPDIKISGMDDDAFWAIKYNQKAVADIVIAGDSRALCDVAPEEMKKAIKGKRIYNFAFVGADFNSRYYDAVESVLDPKSRERVIVFGVSSRGLLNLHNNNKFEETAKTSGFDRFILAHFERAWSFIKPYSTYPLLDRFDRKGDSSVFYLKYYYDGWQATNRIPPDLEHDTKAYRADFKSGHRVSPELEKELAKRIRTLSKKGICVFAFRPPASAEMQALENGIGGYGEKRIANLVTSAGGRWIRVDPSPYQTHDGSHLTEDEARAFSKELAVSLKSGLPSCAGAYAK
jgi:hypothetical protein